MPDDLRDTRPGLVPLPTSVTIPIPASAVGELAFYSNNRGTMEAIGQR